jgi:hypothetical protein
VPVADGHGEFVPAEPSGDTALTAPGGQPLSRGRDDGVSGLVAEGVIDRLEAVQVPVPSSRMRSPG